MTDNLPRPRFRDLTPQEQNLGPEIGNEMRLDTALLIYMLQDNHLYTAAKAAATRYHKVRQKEIYKRMKARLIYFTSYRKMPESPDAEVEGRSKAWYGRTWKARMGDRSYFRAELNWTLLQTLHAIRGAKEQEINKEITSSKALHKRKPQNRIESGNLHERLPNGKSIKWKHHFGAFIKSGWFAASLLSIFILVHAYRHTQVDPGQHTITVLPCYQQEMGLVVPEMVTRALEATDTLIPVSLHRMEHLTQTDFCTKPNETVRRELIKELDVDFLLWGRVEKKGQGYLWIGNLFYRNGKSRNLKIRAGHYRALANTIARKCLRLLGSDESPPSVVALNSPNLIVSIFSSEANIHYYNGNIVAAPER